MLKLLRPGFQASANLVSGFKGLALPVASGLWSLAAGLQSLITGSCQMPEASSQRLKK
jgi:hypothetical protein